MIVFEGVRTIAKRSAGIVFGMWGGDRCWGCRGAIAFWEVWEVRSLFWDLGRRSLFGKCGRCDRLLGMWRSDRFLGSVGGAIAFRNVRRAIAFWDLGRRSLLGCERAIAFGM